MATKRTPKARSGKKPREVTALQHDEAKRKNIPTADRRR
jgi:hypothetical protein